MGRRRAAQLARLATGSALRALSPAERDANRRLLLGGVALGLLALAPVTGWPLLPLVLALGLHKLVPFAREVWRMAVEERRLSILHLLFAYMATLWLGGWLVVAAVGVVFAGVAHKLELLTQLVARHNLSDLLEAPPARVWVLHDGVELEIPFAALKHGDLLVLGGRIQVRVERTGAQTTAARIAAVLAQTVEKQEVRLGDQLTRLDLPDRGAHPGGHATAVARIMVPGRGTSRARRGRSGLPPCPFRSPGQPRTAAAASQSQRILSLSIGFPMPAMAASETLRGCSAPAPLIPCRRRRPAQRSRRRGRSVAALPMAPAGSTR